MDKIVTEADMNNWETVREFYEIKCSEAGLNPEGDDCLDMCMALEEFYTNTASYAYGGQKGNVTVVFDYEDSNLIVKIFDNGKEFNPLLKEDPKMDVPIEEMRIGGLGIFMSKMYLDEVKYEYTDGQNIITLVKNTEKCN